ncbi:MAG: mechanosensitive ion channel family protein [Gemmatimonadaceae bacterium]
MSNWTFYHNSLSRWMTALAALGVTIILLYVIRRIAVGRLDRLARSTTTEADDFAVDLLRRTRFFFIFALALAIATSFLALDADARQVVRVITVLATAIQAMIWGSGIVTFGIERYARRQGDAGGVSPTTVSALSYVGRFVLFLIILIIALDSMGVEVTALVTGLGVGGIALALAVQNILGDLFGALSIVLDKPFVVGDAIAVDQFDGTVENIGLKTTRLRAGSGEQVVFSNADLLKSRIRNFRRLEQRRVILSLGVALDTPPELAEQVPAMIADVVKATPQTRFDRAHLRIIGDSAILYEAVYFITTPDYVAYMDAQQSVNLALLRRFRDAGIALALPARMVVLRDAAGSLRQDGEDGRRQAAEAGSAVSSGADSRGAVSR